MKQKKWFFLILMVIISIVWGFPATPSIKAGETEYKLDCTDIADLYTQYAVMDHAETAFNKFNASELPAGYTVKSATLYVMCQNTVSAGDWQIYYVANQTWNENDYYLLENTEKSNPANYSTSFVIQQWEAFDLTSIMQINYAAGLENFSIYIEDPEYPIDPENYGNAAGTPWHVLIGISNQTNSCYHWMYYYSQHDVSQNKPEWFPYISVVISTQPPYTGGLGFAFNVEIQPGVRVPTETHNIFFREYSSTSMYKQSGPWEWAETNDANRASFFVAGSYDNFPCTINFVYRDIGYPEALDTLYYETEMGCSEGGITTHKLMIGLRSNSYEYVYDIGTTEDTAGTFNVDTNNWHQNTIWMTHSFKPGGNGRSYDVWFDQMFITFNKINETHVGERLWNGTEYLETVTIQVLQDDCNVTLTNVPTNYVFIKSLPNCSYEQVGQQLTLINVPKGEYMLYFSTSLTRPDLVTCVLNYYINGTNEPLPANTLNSSYVIAGTEYRIEPYTSRFIWDRDNGNITIHSYDYFRRLLVNQSFSIPEDTVFYVIDIGLQLYRLTVHCNTMATLNITNSLNESYYPTFEVSPENATLIKTLWLYGENLTITTHSNDWGDLTHTIDISKTSFANFKYKIPVLWHGERQVPAGKSALLSTIEFIFYGLGIAFIGYMAQHYWKKHRIAEKIDKTFL